MLTLLHPEAHEVTSAVIVPEFGEFKLVVNKRQDQKIYRNSEPKYLKDMFRRHHGLSGCQWADSEAKPDYSKAEQRIKKLNRMIDNHMRIVNKYENEIEQIKRGLK